MDAESFTLLQIKPSRSPLSNHSHYIAQHHNLPSMINKARLFIMLLIAALSSATAVAQEEFKRDIEQISFIPKGQWITGVSVGYSQSSQSKYQFFIFEDLSGDT